MTPKEQARERARLLIAWADGKTLQCLNSGVWEDWDFNKSPGIASPDQWRIKPDPLRKWTTPYSNSHTYDQDLANEWKLKGWPVTEWQEVVK